MDYLTTDEAAALLRLHPETLRRKVRLGEIPASLLGHRLRFRRDELVALFEPRSEVAV